MVNECCYLKISTIYDILTNQYFKWGMLWIFLNFLLYRFLNYLYSINNSFFDVIRIYNKKKGYKLIIAYLSGSKYKHNIFRVTSCLWSQVSTLFSIYINQENVLLDLETICEGFYKHSLTSSLQFYMDQENLLYQNPLFVLIRKFQQQFIVSCVFNHYDHIVCTSLFNITTLLQINYSWLVNNPPKDNVKMVKCHFV
jgi:hypothetical protein